MQFLEEYSIKHCVAVGIKSIVKDLLCSQQTSKREQATSIVRTLLTHSAAMANDIDVREGERVSVYISQPVPWRYSFCHCFMSVLEGTALMANKLDIMLLNPAARQDWAMKPSLNSA